ncbi:MAG: heme lyase CcmF/NrfE family subunit, partial [Bacteroidetes bacterium]|nr:heme lyase CcmF/NrfE family subunit [Bacteroidota bacterium]
WILSAWALAVAVRSRGLPLVVMARVLSVMGFIGVGFIAFSLLTSNPFERLLPGVAPEGADLNPLLQDPGLIIHPPLLYMGYVGLVVPFAFAIAALLGGKLDAAWAKWSRPWTNVAWAFLTLGIMLGSWWAYYELGWGGWWFWDPVENASFMPWLVGTALIHSLAVTEKRGLFRSWTVLLAIAAFSLSLLGTFLVRSGVLTSVHAFAADPERGLFILVFLIIVVGGSLTLYALRSPRVASPITYEITSRESLLLVNNLVFSVSALVVLLGTLYPLFLDALGLGKISVGAPFFNQVFLPLMAPVLMLMGLGPLLPWKRADLANVFGRLKLATALLAIAASVPWMFRDTDLTPPLLASCGFGAATWIACGTLTAWWEQVKPRSGAGSSFGQRLWRLPGSVWGMTLAHLGIAVVIVGITGSSVYRQEAIQNHRIGETIQVGAWSFLLAGVYMGDGPNYDSLSAELVLSKNGQIIGRTYPEKRAYRAPRMATTEVGLYHTDWTDIYTVLGDPVAGADSAFVTRIYIKPLTVCLWYGAIIMAVGGLISAFSRRRIPQAFPSHPPQTLYASPTHKHHTPHTEDA